MRNLLPILLGKENPNGIKLEDLLTQLQSEVLAKTQKVVHDQSHIAQFVIRNNLHIVELLNQAARMQRESMEALDRKAPDNGPEGEPRIGK
jgi:hypothetical protein